MKQIYLMIVGCANQKYTHLSISIINPCKTAWIFVYSVTESRTNTL